jgi:FG-GAP repeat
MRSISSPRPRVLRRRARRGLRTPLAIATLGSLVGLLSISPAIASASAGTPRVSASATQAAPASREALAQAPTGLQTAVRASLGQTLAPASSAFQRAKLTAYDAASFDEFGISVAISGSTAVVGAVGKNSNTGAAYVFVRSGTTWSQQAKLIPSDARASFDDFGYAVAISGSTAVVGAPGKNSFTGAAYVFVASGSTWPQQAKLTASDGAMNDEFGFAVAVSGSTAVVGAPYKSSSTGAAYVFVRSVSTWSQLALDLLASDGASFDLFGLSVAISGSTAVVGADGKNSYTGEAYVFVVSGSSSSQQAKLTASDAVAGDRFGNSVAISGSTAVVGAYRKNPSGAAYVFVRSGTTWPQKAELTAADATAGGEFGFAVTVSGPTVVVGVPYQSGGGYRRGSAYVFSASGSTWSQEAELTASDGADNDEFGYSVAISGTAVLLGAPLKPDTTEAGSAYVFALPSQQAKLTASDGASHDAFGISVAISGSTAVVGAPYKNSSTGAAYVYVRSGTIWSQQAKLIASDAAHDDEFGISVAISGSTAVVGADRKNSYTGAAYVFVRSLTTWSQQAKLTAGDAALNDGFGFAVAISGSTAVVGAPFKNSSTGAAYVFVRSGTIWSQQAKLTAGDAALNDYFGYAVAISGSTAVVGAPYKNSSTGAAYVFVRSGTIWPQQRKLTAGDAALNDLFGYAVAISGSTAVVGAPGKNSYTGAAYVFVRSVSTWSQLAKLTASDGASGDQFGFAVAISGSGSTAVVGAPFKNSYTGAAYMFVASGSTWSQQAKLTALSAALNDEFGYSVAISGSTVVVGAPGKNSYIGAAFVYVLP